MYERDRFHKLKDWENYKQMRNKTFYLIRKRKKNYYNTAIQKGTNAKDFWKNFRKIKNNDNDNTEVTSLPSEDVQRESKVENESRKRKNARDRFSITNIVICSTDWNV